MCLWTLVSAWMPRVPSELRILDRSLGTTRTLRTAVNLTAGYFRVTGAASNVSTDSEPLGLNVPVAPATAGVTTTVFTVRTVRVTNLPLTLTRLWVTTVTFLVTAGTATVFMVMV